MGVSLRPTLSLSFRIGLFLPRLLFSWASGTYSMTNSTPGRHAVYMLSRVHGPDLREHRLTVARCRCAASSSTTEEFLESRAAICVRTGGRMRNLVTVAVPRRRPSLPRYHHRPDASISSDRVCGASTFSLTAT